MRRRFGDRLDRRQIVRLVQRRERHEPGKRRHHPGIDLHRGGEFRAAMHDPWPKASTGRSGQELAAEFQDFCRGAAMIEAAGGPVPFGHDFARGIRRP